MARYSGAVCRYCRRENGKLFLKGDRCYSDKCSFDRRGYPPGQHGQVRARKFSDYGTQLREKQKVKRIYGILEKQFRIYFQHALRRDGITGENLLVLLESRLDNVAYRLAFARTRAEARQLVRHRHIRVNGHTVDIPSFQVKPNDKIEIRTKSRKIGGIQEAMEAGHQRGVPKWLELEAEQFSGTVKSAPTREDIPLDIHEELIVAFYTR